MSYSPEYDFRVAPLGAGILRDVADLTNGRELLLDEPDAAFEHTIRSAATFAPIWSQLLLLAVLLLPFDIAVRRLVVTRRDLLLLWDFVFGTAQTASLETTERMSSLLSARQRAREQMGQPGATSAPGNTISALRQRRESGEPVSEQPVVPPTAAPTDTGETSFAALRRRQAENRQQREGDGITPDVKLSPTTAPDNTPGSNDRAGTGGGNIGSRLLKRRRQDDDK